MGLQPVASDLSYETLQRRRLNAQLGLEPFNPSHRGFHLLSGYNPKLFWTDQGDGISDAAQPNPVSPAIGDPAPLWHVHRKAGK